MKATKVSSEDIRLARMGGFKKKKPKKPKSKTEASLTRYIERYNGWAKLVKEAAKKGKKKDSLKKTVASL